MEKKQQYEYEYISIYRDRIPFTTHLKYDEIDWKEVAQQLESHSWSNESSDAFSTPGGNL